MQTPFTPGIHRLGQVLSIQCPERCMEVFFGRKGWQSTLWFRSHDRTLRPSGRPHNTTHAPTLRLRGREPPPPQRTDPRWCPPLPLPALEHSPAPNEGHLGKGLCRTVDALTFSCSNGSDVCFVLLCVWVSKCRKGEKTQELHPSGFPRCSETILRYLGDKTECNGI